MPATPSGAPGSTSGSPGSAAAPDVSAPGTVDPAGVAAPLPSAPAPAPRELYSQAYADYARGNYDLAIQGFGEYIRNYPGTDFTDNAQYWIGECLYGKKMYTEAVEAWNVLFRDYPSSDKLPDARVKKGMALERLGPSQPGARRVPLRRRPFPELAGGTHRPRTAQPLRSTAPRIACREARSGHW